MVECHDVTKVAVMPFKGHQAKGGTFSEMANFVKCSQVAVIKVFSEWSSLITKCSHHGTPQVISARSEHWMHCGGTHHQNEPMDFLVCVKTNCTANIVVNGVPEQMNGDCTHA